MLNPFVQLLSNAIYLYMICLIVWTVLYTLISFRIVNGQQPLVFKVMYALDRLCKPVLKPIQKVLPDMGGIDISPIIVLLLLNFLLEALHTYFYNL
jgi:YggT family protein